jgi:hypothetical protein
MNEQLQQWLEGNSIHGEQCCPDFSCCNKYVKTPIEVRQRFVKAIKENDKETELQMLGMFLQAAMDTLGKNVYVIDGKSNHE